MCDVDPLLDTTSEDRLVIFPIRHADMWSLYKKAEACFWTAEELDLSHDRKDWDALSDGERTFLLNVLAFFAASDGIVNENLAANFAHEVAAPEARCFYGFQIAIENIHAEVYSLLIDTYVSDGPTKDRALRAVSLVPSVRAKAQWALRWTKRDAASFAERCVAFACVEGIFFSASFCAIFYMKKRGKLPGLCTSNELISRDEGLHCDFACLLFSKLRERPTPARVLEIVQSAVNAEHAFVRDSLRLDLLGMNSTAMCQYVEFCADRLLESLGQPKHYGATCPFEWMTLISMQGKTNFFEKRVSEYAKAGVGADTTEATFDTDVDF
jgi:ribonucleoside-diphosphate reductase subunit M2